jgi:transmembrane sensor
MMPITDSHIAKLLLKRAAGDLSPGEALALEDWRRKAGIPAADFQALTHPRDLQQLRADYAEALDRSEHMALPALKDQVIRPVHRVHFLKTAWFRYAAAILIVFGLLTYFYINHQKDKALITQHQPVPVQHDIAPGSNKATLTLSNGSIVELNNSRQEKINDGTLSIDHHNGQLIYRNSTIHAMNTMSTPAGGQYQLTLSDGSKVWLNAASSITYPTAFVEKTREVNVTGEAYFEIAPNKTQPFIVKTPKDHITVLGTAFNVNAYPDEPVSKTSLITGSIKISDKVIQPGQAYFHGKVIQTNSDQDIAWKNGVFNFNDMDVASAMRQISRWYNVNIVYPGKVPDEKLIGELGRDLTLSQVLQSLSDIGIHTQLDGHVLTVLSK